MFLFVSSNRANVRLNHRLFALVFILTLPLVIGGTKALAQGSPSSLISGRVLVDSLRVPVRGAEIRIPKLALTTTSDSAGRFRLARLPEGRHVLEVRAWGYVSDTVVVEVGQDESVAVDIVLRTSVATLEAVRVSAPEVRSVPAKLAGFEERRKQGVGRFIDRGALKAWENKPTGDLFSTLPGVDIRRVQSKAFAIGSRAHPSLTTDRRRDPCYLDVYLDGALVFNGAFPGADPFNLNTVTTSSIEAIEVYASAAQIPARYNRTAKGCGVILIWTRSS